MTPKSNLPWLPTHSGKAQPIHCSTLVFSFSIIMLFLLLAPVKSMAQSTKTFTVNMIGDESDPNAGEIGDDGKCDVDPITQGDQCTFRAAVENQNGNRNLGQNQIKFEIPNAPGSGSIIIKIGSTGLGPLPAILGSVFIDAKNNDGRRIELDGSAAGGGAIGLKLLGGTCHIAFFVINNFSSHGIFISGTPPPGEGSHQIESNYIGTDSTGTIAKGNGGDGIFIDNTGGNKIGGQGVLRNIISGNAGYGINIQGLDPSQFGTNGAQNNQAEGNLIGLDISGENALPNKGGGVLLNNAPNNTIGNTDQNKGNKMAGNNTNGVTITGSLTEGIKILGNFIGENKTGVKFAIGILASAKPITIEGNFITDIAGVGIDLFVNADGGYNIRKNSFEGDMKIGSKLRFADGKTVQIVYENNFHTGNGMAMDVEESLHGKIDWLVAGATMRLGQAGINIIFHAAGNKNFSNGVYDANAGVAFNFTIDVAESLQMTFKTTGDAYTGNGAEGRKGRIVLKTGAELAYSIVGSSAVNNGKDGERLDVIADIGASATITNTDNRYAINAGIGLRLIGDGKNLVTVRAFVERNILEHNTFAGIDVTSLFSGKSIIDNTITNNGGPGIIVDGTTIAHLEGNTISGNSIGVLVNDAATANMIKNTVTTNGKGVVLAGTATGSPLTANSIFKNNGLGIDLGNDGLTVNDAGDADTGPNNRQNFPVLTAVNSAGGNTSIQGTLNSTANTVFRLDFFSNDACNPSGFGEGQTFLDSFKVTTDANGNADFTALLTGKTVPVGAAVTATATDPNNNTSEFSACLQTGNTPKADLELVKQADKAQYTVGDQVIFTISLVNKGPANASGIEVSDLLPVGISFGQATTTAGTYDNTTGKWLVGGLPSGQQVTLTITGTLTQSGTISNTAELKAVNEPDPDSSPGNAVATEDDQSTVAIVVLPAALKADLELIKQADKAQYTVGDQVIFTIGLVNKGPANASGIEVTDLLPAGILIGQATTTVGTYDNITGKWLVGGLSSGQQATLTITGTVTQQGTISNTAELTAANEPDPDSAPGNGVATEDDQSTVAIVVLPQAVTADLEVTKQADKAQYNVGDPVLFTITLVNKGPANASGIVVTDLLPAGIVFNQAIVPTGSYDNGSGKWMVGTLNSGQQATLIITGTITQSGTISNTAELTAAVEPDPDSAPGNAVASEDDQSTVSIQVAQQASIPAQINQLIQQVASMVNKHELSVNEGKLLTRLLNIALNRYNKGEIRATIFSLKEFIFLVKVFTHKDHKAKADAKALIRGAQDIIDQLKPMLPHHPRWQKESSDDELNLFKADENSELSGFRFKGNYPNPFNSFTFISFELKVQTNVQMIVYDVNGRIITKLLDKVLLPGVQTVTWQTPNLPQGIYILQVRAGRFTQSFNMVHIK